VFKRRDICEWTMVVTLIVVTPPKLFCILLFLFSCLLGMVWRMRPEERRSIARDCPECGTPMMIIDDYDSEFVAVYECISCRFGLYDDVEE
jgi:predicted RNA-binding Zn-ribbon protein involved in translation (DUF1610 family)